MKKREPVSKIMSKDLYTVNQTQSLLDVKNLLDEHRIRHVPVVSGSQIIGMISKTDLLSITYGQDGADSNMGILQSLKIEDVMTRDLDIVAPDTLIRDVAEIFVEKDFSALPVVQDEKLCGIVTTKDVMRFLLEMF